MNKIIVEPKNKDEFQSLEIYLKQNGIGFKTEEEYKLEKQKALMNEFAHMLSQAPHSDITDDEIDKIVDEVRAKRYEANRS